MGRLMQLPIPGSDKLTFIEKEPNYFEEVNGRDQLFVYKTKSGETHISLSSLPMMPLEKVETLTDLLLPLLLLQIFLLVLVLTVFILPSGWLWHRLRKKPQTGGMSHKWIVWLASLLYLVFVAVHFANLLNPYSVMGPKTIVWDFFTYLPLMLFVFFLYQGWCWFKIERKGTVGWWRKVSGDLLVLTGILLTPWMIYWNLVGEFF